jgi:cytochrome c peroxidase
MNRSLKNNYIFFLLFTSVTFLFVSFKNSVHHHSYTALYHERLDKFNEQQSLLIKTISESNLNSNDDLRKISAQVEEARRHLKGLDFWLRYLEPIAYKKINGPLPVEWETEVFEKSEKPYKRQGAGLTLATLYLEEENIRKDSLLNLIVYSIQAAATFKESAITAQLNTPHHFFLCNRLFLLNLAAIYTTGFECPDTSRIIPELRTMLGDVCEIYAYFNNHLPDKKLPGNYLSAFENLIKYTKEQPSDYTQFDHFTFLRDYINPLFAINQQLIVSYDITSRSYVDHSLNKSAASIFSKTLFSGQNPKGIFLRVRNEAILSEIDSVGKLLFYDPILSGNNLRSCASCHKPTQYFTDTLAATPVQFNRKDLLPRNTPSLINVEYNHLLMLDGKHISLQDQTKAVITSPTEMGSGEKELLKKILSCREYHTAFTKFLQYTPQEKEITFDHIVSSITLYYSKFSKSYGSFDAAMNENRVIPASIKEGFNLFMSKAQCATCHFVPQFNGVKPPYTNSEFEVLGVPVNKINTTLSPDKGRNGIHAADETLNAFRTGSLRNTAYTKPYMHNGVFSDLNEVIDFYNAGGGAGRGLKVDNQTLSGDSLQLTAAEKKKLILFIRSLDEDIKFEKPPESLPVSKIKILNTRKVAGEY